MLHVYRHVARFSLQAGKRRAVCGLVGYDVAPTTGSFVATHLDSAAAERATASIPERGPCVERSSCIVSMQGVAHLLREQRGLLAAVPANKYLANCGLVSWRRCSRRSAVRCRAENAFRGLRIRTPDSRALPIAC